MNIQWELWLAPIKCKLPLLNSRVKPFFKLSKQPLLLSISSCFDDNFNLDLSRSFYPFTFYLFKFIFLFMACLLYTGNLTSKLNIWQCHEKLVLLWNIDVVKFKAELFSEFIKDERCFVGSQVQAPHNSFLKSSAHNRSTFCVALTH